MEERKVDRRRRPLLVRNHTPHFGNAFRFRLTFHVRSECRGVFSRHTTGKEEVTSVMLRLSPFTRYCVSPVGLSLSDSSVLATSHTTSITVTGS